MGANQSTNSQDDDLRTAYQQLCESYRAIDDFRAKLLGLLPLATGAGIFLLVTDSEKIAAAMQFLAPIGIFGFVVTLALFFYELHGILKCDHLIKVGRQIEGRLGINGQFRQRPGAGVAGFINEPFTARIIYPTVLAAWAYLALAPTWPLVAGLIAIVVFTLGFVGSHFFNLKVKLQEEQNISGVLVKLLNTISTDSKELSNKDTINKLRDRLNQLARENRDPLPEDWKELSKLTEINN